MNRPITIWLMFSICLLVLLAAMGWVTTETLRLERMRKLAESQGEFQERARLALWRIDSALSNLIIEESTRPPVHFAAFHEPEQVYTKSYQALRKGDVLAPSPLLTEQPEIALLYYQYGNDGTLSSPQVPAGNDRDLAESRYTTGEKINESARRLERLDAMLGPRPIQAETSGVAAEKPAALQSGWDRGKNLGKDRVEANVRARLLSQKTSRIQNPELKKEILAKERDPLIESVIPAEVPAGFEGRWKSGHLLLERSAILDGKRVAQGIWVDWPKLHLSLLEEIRDLFPAAQLIPIESEGALGVTNLTDDAFRLVSLPARLVPGKVHLDLESGSNSPLRRSLIIAWVCVLGAAAAVAVVLSGLITLSERRAAFVSAVTHELRTPLTTFRMYSEMLANDIVPSPEKRASYLRTLQAEANRLSHLVENVLAYARLVERGSARRHVETITLEEIIERIRPRLEQRVHEAGMKLEVDCDALAGKKTVQVDVSAVEQIVFNLVDNACKYANENADAQRIHLEAATEGPLGLLRVRDHGQGISSREARRLFRPFEKSATEAAHTAPGVGLGLALSRKLSRSIGGELKLCPNDDGTPKGACFVLQLPPFPL